LETWWRLIDRNREPVRGGIIGIRILLDRLGYKDGSFEGTDENFSEIFSQITDAKPELLIRVSYKEDWQNIRILNVIEKEEAEA
jgi:hypothetical protein